MPEKEMVSRADCPVTERSNSDDTAMRISHEAIYQYIYVLPRGALKDALLKGLRQERKYRRKRGKRSPETETRGRSRICSPFEERPAPVADRTVPGHWEGDLILGKHKQSALGTLVERTTRKVILVPLKSKDAAGVRKAFARELRVLPEEMRKSLTHDQGKEMSEHKRFTIDTGIQVYFAHPRIPLGTRHQRGTPTVSFVSTSPKNRFQHHIQIYYQEDGTGAE